MGTASYITLSNPSPQVVSLLGQTRGRVEAKLAKV